MLDICVAGFQCQSWIDISFVREVSSPLLSDPIRSEASLPIRKMMPGRSLTLHFELSVGSIVLLYFSGGGASYQLLELDPNNAHDKKTCTHVRKGGAFFIGSDEKLPILLQLKNTLKVYLSLLTFSSNNLSLHEPVMALYPPWRWPLRKVGETCLHSDLSSCS